jgi:hypothetical protein
VTFWCGEKRGGCQSRERGREIKSSSDAETLRNDGKVLGKILLLLYEEEHKKKKAQRIVKHNSLQYLFFILATSRRCCYNLLPLLLPPTDPWNDTN